MGDDSAFVASPAMKWLLSVVDEGGSKRDATLHDGLRSYSLAQANLYLSGLPKMSASEQADIIGAAFLRYLG